MRVWLAVALVALAFVLGALVTGVAAGGAGMMSMMHGTSPEEMRAMMDACARMMEQAGA